MSLLELNGIEKRFGSVEALRGVTLAVEAGSVVGLVGDNGAGKSTLMKTITGIYQPDGGAILFDGQEVTSDTPGHIRSIGIEMIYQDLALAPQQDVASNIFLGREPTKMFLGFIPGLIDRPKIVAEAERMAVWPQRWQRQNTVARRFDRSHSDTVTASAVSSTRA